MKKILFLALVMLVIAPAANAGGWYVGAAIMQTGIEIDSESFDEDDTGIKILGGYRINDHFAVEAAYGDHGEPEETGAGLETTTLSAFAVGTLPLGEQFELFAKAGFTQWDVEGTGDASGLEDDDVEVAFGVGGKFKLGEKFALRLEYELFEVEVEGGTDADVGIISLGGEWRF